MFLWAGRKAPGAGSDHRSIYRRICQSDVLDRRKTVTALRAGEDRAVLLGLGMVLSSVMMYFVLGVTVLRSYTDSVWTDEHNCTVVNATIAWDVNCSYGCGPACRRTSHYPCLQVHVRLDATDQVVRLLRDEEAHGSGPECFYVPQCQKEYAASRAAVQDVSQRLKSLGTVRCFVGRRTGGGAILAPFYGRAAAFYSLFWPTCVLVGGSAIIAMVKLTQYLSVTCERPSRVGRGAGTLPVAGQGTI